MRLNLVRHFFLTCCAFAMSGWLLVACGASLNLEKTSTGTSFDMEFSSARVEGKEFTVPSGKAIVMYSDHLPQAGGSGDEAVSKAVLEHLLKTLSFSTSFKQIPAVWGLINHCRYTM